MPIADPAHKLSWDDDLQDYGEQRDFSECRRLIPLTGQYMMPVEDIQQHLRETTAATHGHQHTTTCKKGGRRGDHTDCRMGFDRVRIEETCLIEDLAFAVKQHDGFLVPFVPAVQLACPGNHMIQTTCDAARYIREVLLFADEKECHPDPLCQV